MRTKNVSIQTLRRLPLYLHYLKSVKDELPRISATLLADALGAGDVQVRKDLGSVSGNGRPKKDTSPRNSSSTSKISRMQFAHARRTDRSGQSGQSAAQLRRIRRLRTGDRRGVRRLPCRRRHESGGQNGARHGRARKSMQR